MLNFGFSYLSCEVFRSLIALQNKFEDNSSKRHHYLPVNMNSISRQIYPYPATAVHTHTAATTHTHLFSLFPLHNVSSSTNLSTQQVHTRIPWINSIQWVSLQLVQCSRLSCQHGEWVNMLWEKKIARRSVFPHAPSLSVAGSRWQGMAARHGSLGCQEMAIIAATPWLSVPLSPLRKVPLYVLRDIFPKCV